MNPQVIAALMQAANGHAGLPAAVHAPGALPAQLPPSAGAPAGRDTKVAEQATHALLSATAAASDPELKAVFTQCLAALHKYIAADQKEHQQALAGKMSPKIMARAHGAA